MRELHAQPASLRAAGKSAKPGACHPTHPIGQNLRLRSGGVAVDPGQRSKPGQQGLPPLAALASISRLALSRVASLPALRSDGTAEGDIALAIDAVQQTCVTRRGNDVGWMRGLRCIARAALVNRRRLG